MDGENRLALSSILSPHRYTAARTAVSPARTIHRLLRSLRPLRNRSADSMKHASASQMKVAEPLKEDRPVAALPMILNTGFPSRNTGEPRLSDRGTTVQEERSLRFLLTPFGLSSSRSSLISRPAITFREPRVALFTRYHLLP